VSFVNYTFFTAATLVGLVITLKSMVSKGECVQMKKREKGKKRKKTQSRKRDTFENFF
jgi:hypothetical protein